MKCCLLLMLCGAAALLRGATGLDDGAVRASLSSWEVQSLGSGGRIDAICDLGDGTVLCATRKPDPGRIFLSSDYGAHWHEIASPTRDAITCLAARGRQAFYLLTDRAEIFGTGDGGGTWRQLRPAAPNRNRVGAAAAYGLVVTQTGTLLTNDTDSDGGHVYRSADDGATWADLGIVSSDALYRFMRVGNGIVLNGFEGSVFKSTDDGRTWNRQQKLGDSALFATEYLGASYVLQADQAGRVYRSGNLGERWENVAVLRGSADDFINIGHGAVLYSTYTEEREVYASLDYGKNWVSLGALPTASSGDWLDHGIRLDAPDFVVAIAGTVKGNIVRQVIPRVRLAELTRVARQGGGTAPSKRPNVLLIITDQQQAGMMSCTGNRYVSTPALDRLAASGVRFEKAFCANPVCGPSRTSMMTGVLPSRMGIGFNEGVMLPVPEKVLNHSLGRVFRGAGYVAAYGGKWHSAVKPAESGFEFISKDERAGLANACVAFLRGKHEQPFLLVASFINPHDICYMGLRDYAQAKKIYWPALMNSKVELRDLDEALKLPPGVSREEFFARICPPLPDNFEVPPGEAEGMWTADNRVYRHYIRENWSTEQWRLHRWAYSRLTEKADAEIGQVLDALRETGLDENTLVVFTSDHGEMAGAHRLEHKSVPYEEAIRIPLIVSYKGVVRPGVVDREHLISTGLDLIPTLMGFAGIPVPSSLPGQSLHQVAQGQQTSWRSYVVIEGGAFRVIRTARYKYVIYNSGDRREQLIDLNKDPGEMRNLAGSPEYQSILAEHRQYMREWIKSNQDTIAAAYIIN